MLAFLIFPYSPPLPGIGIEFIPDILDAGVPFFPPLPPGTINVLVSVLHLIDEAPPSIPSLSIFPPLPPLPIVNLHSACRPS